MTRDLDAPAKPIIATWRQRIAWSWMLVAVLFATCALLLGMLLTQAAGARPGPPVVTTTVVPAKGGNVSYFCVTSSAGGVWCTEYAERE